ncbi:MAG: hypothetical protein ABII27_04130 [bacterium]
MNIFRLLVKFLFVFAITVHLFSKISFARNTLNPYIDDSEYELDIFQNYFHPDWVFDWETAENAFRTTGGSLNMRHIYHLQEAKFRFPLVENKLWFRYRHDLEESLVFNSSEDAIELEYLPFANILTSVMMEPHFHKGDIDIGYAVAYGVEEGNRIRLEYHLIDYDKNYAFHDKSVNEGFEEYLNKGPREFKVKINNIKDMLKFSFNARYQTPGELRHIELGSTQEEYIEEFQNWKLGSELLVDSRAVSPGLRVDMEGNYKDTAHKPAPMGADYEIKDKRYLVRPYFIINRQGKVEYFTGCSLINLYGEKIFHLDHSMDEYYSTKEISPFVFCCYYPFRGSNKHFFDPAIEFGYMHDSIFEERKLGAVFFNNTQRENRIRLAVEFVFSEHMRMKIISGWEVDGEDFDKFSIFDGGYFQFQGVF